MEIKLPAGHEASKLRWFSVWCKRFSENFGDVMFETRASTANTQVVESEEASAAEEEAPAEEESAAEEETNVSSAENETEPESTGGGSNEQGSEENGSGMVFPAIWLIVSIATVIVKF